MEFLTDIDLPSLIRAIGLVGIFIIIFAESGLLIGFFLPGDSLLFTAGFLASQGYLNIWLLMVLCLAGAVLGDSFGYLFGKRLGPSIFRREDSWLFHKNNLERAKRFYQVHGKTTIVLARFMPVIRTFAPILAGVGHMHYPTFLFYNVAGGILWAVGLTGLGYWLGETVPGVDRYIVPIIIGVVILTTIPTIWHFLRDKETKDRFIRMVSSFISKKT